MRSRLRLIPQPTQEKLREYLAKVLSANRQFNLTSVRDPDEAWTKHVVDSLQALETGLLGEPGTLIDIGTGAGFPGAVLAIARPQLQVTLLDSTQKKCRFLEATCEKLQLDIKVLCARAEQAGQDSRYRKKFDFATTRAVGSLSEVCELTLPFLVMGGNAILWRGAEALTEAQAAKSAIAQLGGEAKVLLEYQLPGKAQRYHLVVVEKRRVTPNRFPRRDGLPKSDPL